MAVVAELTALFGIKTDSKSAKTAQETVQKVADGARRLLGFVAAAAASGAIAKMVSDTAALGDQIAKTSEKVGVSVQGLQELRFAAQQSGVATSTLDQSLQTLTKGAAEAALGMGSAREAFARMGVSVRDANGNVRPTEALLGDVADAMQGVTDPSERLRLATQLFGESGTSLINTLKDGRSGLNAYRKEARRLGGVMDAQLTARSSALVDEQGRLSESLKGVRNELSRELIPLFIKSSEGTRKFLTSVRLFIRANLKDTIEFISSSLKTMIGFWDSLNTTFNGTLPIVLAVVAALIKFKTVVSLLKALGLVIASPLVKLAALAALIALIIEDFGVWQRGGNSVIGSLLGNFEDFRATIEPIEKFLRENLTAAWEFIKGAATELFGFLSSEGPGALQSVADAAMEVFNFLATEGPAAIQAIAEVIQPFVDFVTTQFSLIATAVTALFRGDMATAVDALFMAIDNGAGFIFEILVGTFRGIVEFIRNVDWVAVFTVILDAMQTVFDSALEVVNTIMNKITEAVVAIVANLIERIPKIFGGIGEFFGRVFGEGEDEPGSDITGAAGRGAAAGLNSLVDFAQGGRAPGSVAPSVGNVAGGANSVNVEGSTVNVNVEARTNASAQEIGSETGRATRQAMASENRRLVRTATARA